MGVTLSTKPMLLALIMFGYSDVGYSVFWGFAWILIYYSLKGLGYVRTRTFS